MKRHVGPKCVMLLGWLDYYASIIKGYIAISFYIDTTKVILENV